MLCEPLQNRRLTVVLLLETFFTSYYTNIFLRLENCQISIQITPPYVCKRAQAAGTSHIGYFCLLYKLRYLLKVTLAKQSLARRLTNTENCMTI